MLHAFFSICVNSSLIVVTKKEVDVEYVSIHMSETPGEGFDTSDDLL